MSKESALASLTGTSNPSPVAIPHSPGLVEAPKAEATQAAPEEALKSKRFAEFAKKEAEIVKAREEVKLEKQRLKEFFDKAKSFEDKKSKGDFLGALKDVGLSETDIFNLMAEAGAEKPAPTAEEIAKKVAAETLNTYKQEQQELQAKIEKEKNDSIVSNFKKQITTKIGSEKDKYEYVHFNGAVAEELVFDTINQVLIDSNGTDLMDVNEALELVESYYEDMDKAMSSLKKRQPKIEAPKEADMKTVQRNRTIVPPLGKTPDAPKTLTNRVTPTAASTLPRKETSEQKKARLIQALKNGSL